MLLQCPGGRAASNAMVWMLQRPFNGCIAPTRIVLSHLNDQTSYLLHDTGTADAGRRSGASSCHSPQSVLSGRGSLRPSSRSRMSAGDIPSPRTWPEVAVIGYWGSSNQCIRGHGKSFYLSTFEFSDTTPVRTPPASVSPSTVTLPGHFPPARGVKSRSSPTTFALLHDRREAPVLNPHHVAGGPRSVVPSHGSSPPTCHR